MSTSIEAVLKFLKKAETHFASRLPLSPTAPAKSSIWDESTSPISASVDYREDVLGKTLLESMKNELLNEMKFTAMSGKSTPEVALFGDISYNFTGVNNLQLQPIKEDSAISKVLDTVNGKLGTNYNSVLVNKYKTKKVELSWHKDDERKIDSSVPISTLSFGATRRFLITDSKERDKRTQGYERLLQENSILTMQPNLQKSHFHKLAEGRNNERGVRFSMTFRRLIKPGMSVPTSLQLTSPLSVNLVNAQPNVPNTSHYSGNQGDATCRSTSPTPDNHQGSVHILRQHKFGLF